MTSGVRRSIATTILLALVPAAAVGQSKGGKMQTRHIFVRVVDQQGAPVAGLTAGDFSLTEAGVSRVVTNASPARSLR